jgi:hypothetical protein
MISVVTERSEIYHISFTFPITVANENFNLAGAVSFMIIDIMIICIIQA